jgi:hypothetical protein
LVLVAQEQLLILRQALMGLLPPSMLLLLQVVVVVVAKHQEERVRQAVLEEARPTLQLVLVLEQLDRDFVEEADKSVHEAMVVVVVREPLEQMALQVQYQLTVVQVFLRLSLERQPSMQVVEAVQIAEIPQATL